MATSLRHLTVAIVLVAVGALGGCGDDDDLGVPTEPTIEVPAAEDPGDPGQPPPEDSDRVARQMERLVFDLVNQERRERGLEPFEWDRQLAELARDWNEEMAEDARLEHQEPERMLERAEGFTGVGENIFRGRGPVSASTVHVGWMRSDGHRANVLHPDFERMGVGFLCTDDGELWATQRFGTTDTSGFTAPDEQIPTEQPIVASEGEGPTCPSAQGEPRLEPR